MQDIEFYGDERALRDFPHPYPAAQSVPEWLKDMTMAMGDEPTIKRCPPFLQAITAGYILPLATDCHFTCDANGKLGVRSEFSLVEAHFPTQYASSPFRNAAVVKFLNPWLVKTPPGYSTLFCAPMNRFETPFAMLCGIVETDTFYREVHFPAISTLRQNSSFTLPKGAPLMQAIPIKREEWESKLAQSD